MNFNDDIWQMEDIQGGSLFEETYQCASASSLPSGQLRDTVEYGNKSSLPGRRDLYILNAILVLLPVSALETLSRLNIMYPMMFRVTSEATGRSTFCGVLEFSAPEGVVYLPPWVGPKLGLLILFLVVDFKGSKGPCGGSS